MAMEKVQMPADTIYRELAKAVTRIQQQEQRSGVVVTESGNGHCTLKFQAPAAPSSGQAATAPAGSSPSAVPASSGDEGGGI
jgi:hypothetical protein